MKVVIGPNAFGLHRMCPDLQKEFPELEFALCAEPKDLPAAIADTDIYMGWLNRDVFLAAKKLQWIQSPSSGVNYYLAIPDLVASDVLLTSASGTHGACVAESAMAMILAFTRGIRDAVLRQQQRVWAGREIRPKLVELTGSTMGIVGLGKIGRSLARRAAAFDMRVIAVDMYPVDKPDCVAELWGLDRLGDLLRESDYVVVTVPYTPQTHGMIGAKELALMKPTAMIVPMSRGGIVDQQAMIQALKEKRLAAAAMDVTDPEPLPPDSELWGMENVLIVPHIAGGSQFEVQHIKEIFVENLRRFLRGDLPLRNQVDKKRGF